MFIAKKFIVALSLISIFQSTQAALVAKNTPIPTEALRATRSFVIKHEKRTKLIAEWTPLPTVLQDIVCDYEAPRSGSWAATSTIKNKSWFFIPSYLSLVYLSSNRIAAGTRGGYIQIIDPLKGSFIQRANDHKILTNAIHTLVHDANSNEIIAGTDDGTINVWNDKTYKYLYTLKGAASNITSLCFFNSSKLLVSGSEISNRLFLWNMGSRTCTKTFMSPSWHTKSLAALSKDQFVSTGSDPYVSIWDINTQKIVYRQQIFPKVSLQKAITLDRDTVAIAYRNILVLYDARSRKIISSFESHTDKIEDLLSHHGTLISQSGEVQENTIQLHDPRKLEKGPLQVINVAGNWISALASDPDSSAFSASVEPGIIKTWSLSLSE